MATTQTTASRRGTIKVETGTSASGGVTYATRSISNMNPSVTDEVAYDVLSAIGNLQSLPIGDLGYVDTCVLSRS